MQLRLIMLLSQVDHGHSNNLLQRHSADCFIVGNSEEACMCVRMCAFVFVYCVRLFELH